MSTPEDSRGRRRGRRRRLAARGWITLTVCAAVAVGGCATVAAQRSGGLANLAARTLGFLISPFQSVVARQATQRGRTATQPLIRPQAEEPITVLVLGTESAPGYAGPQLTDSMLVVAYDPRADSVSILSVPRDLWIDIPTFGYQRINTALENVGIAGAELTVEQYIGVPIEYYAIVNYNTFTQVVDDVGGVNVDVPYAISDSCYPNAAENQCTVFDLAAGEQHLDGATALKFARERHSFATGDIQREADQQLVLLALKQQMLQPQNWLKIPEIVGQMSNLLQTNFPLADAPSLAEQLLRLPSGNVQNTVLSYPGAVNPYTTSGGALVLLPDEAAIHQIVSQMFPRVLADISQMSVQVQNGAPTNQDLATQFSQILQTMGVHTLPAEQAAQTNLTANEVFVNTAAVHLGPRQPLPTEALMLGQMLGTQPQTASLPSSSAQIVVELGTDYAGYSGATPSTGGASGAGSGGGASGS